MDASVTVEPPTGSRESHHRSDARDSPSTLEIRVNDSDIGVGGISMSSTADSIEPSSSEWFIGLEWSTASVRGSR